MGLKNTISTILLAISFSTYSQTIVFNELYDIDSLNNSFNPHIELTNGDFVCASQASVAFGTKYIYFTRIDILGNEIWKKK